MSRNDPWTLLGYVTAALTAGAGILLFTGFLLPPSVPVQLRVMFGIVLVLLSVYRIVITRTKQRQAYDNEDDD